MPSTTVQGPPATFERPSFAQVPLGYSTILQTYRSSSGNRCISLQCDPERLRRAAQDVGLCFGRSLTGAATSDATSPA